jgi:hypothetical protein
VRFVGVHIVFRSIDPFIFSTGSFSFWVRNAEGKTAVELCVVRALSSPDALPALHRLLELLLQTSAVKTHNNTSSLLSFALLHATQHQQQQQQQQQLSSSSSRARGRRAGGKEKGKGVDGVPLCLDFLPALAPIYTMGWDAGWREGGRTGKSQGQLLALLAPPAVPAEGGGCSDRARLLYDKIVRAALGRGVLVPRVLASARSD